MKIKKYIIIIIVLSLNLLGVYSQDYFEDANGNGLAILYGDRNSNLLSSRINTQDNSIKINFFNNIFIRSLSSLKPGNEKKIYFGWGLFVKGKAENGFSNLIKSGNLQQGFNSGGYLSMDFFHTKSNDVKGSSSWLKFIFFASYNYSNLNVYDPALNFNSQLYDTNFYGYNLGFSGFLIPPFGKNFLVLGFSLLVSKTNNYSSLDMYEIKDNAKIIDSMGNITREIIEDKEDYIYAMGQFKEFNKYKVKINVGYVPNLLNHKVGFIFYPSIDYQFGKNPVYNMGLSINFLKDEIPILSDAGIIIEFSDFTNSKDSQDKFIKRSMKVGLNAAWNILTNEKN